MTRKPGVNLLLSRDLLSRCLAITHVSTANWKAFLHGELHSFSSSPRFHSARAPNANASSPRVIDIFSSDADEHLVIGEEKRILLPFPRLC